MWWYLIEVVDNLYQSFLSRSGLTDINYGTVYDTARVVDMSRLGSPQLAQNRQRSIIIQVII